MAVCQSVFTDEDEQMLNEALARAERGEGSPISPELHARLNSREFQTEVEAAMEQRCLERLDENSKERRDEFSKKLAAKGREASLLEKIDRDQWPTKLEGQATWRIGRALGMSPLQITNIPAIKVVSKTDPVPLIKETVRQLHSCKKMPRAMWEEYAVNKIVYIDRRAHPSIKRTTVGYVEDTDRLKGNPSLLNVVHIISDETGQFPVPERLRWILSHEICHLHEVETDDPIVGTGASGVFKAILEDPAQWQKAVVAQFKAGPVTHYSTKRVYETIENSLSLRSSDRVNVACQTSEFICEHFAAWVTESCPEEKRLCQEMKDFFDEFVPRIFR